MASRKITILLPDLRGGGAERVNLALASAFATSGLEIEFGLMRERGELLDELSAAWRVVDLGAPRVRDLWPALHRYFRTTEADAVLAAMWPLTGVACLAKRTARSRARLVVSEHNDFREAPAIKPVEHALLRRLGPWIYGSADAVVGVSRGVIDSLQECASLPAERCTVIHNPIRPVAEAPPEPEDAPLFAWWEGARHRLVAIGTLKEQKGFDVLLDAVARLPAEVDARLVILGEGPLRAALEGKVAALGLGERVRLPGFRANPYAFLRRAHLFVLSSRWEGFGNVVVEALAGGVPVVATDCRSGPAEILEDGRFGTLVAVDDPDALAGAVTRALATDHDPEALRRRATDFTPEIASARYLDLLFPSEALHSP